MSDGERVDDLYSGTAGVLLGCAEAVSAGEPAGPGSALGRVTAGARDRLIHLAGQEPAAGVPAAGVPAAGVPAAGELAAGELAAGELVAGVPAAGELAAGELADDGLFTGSAG